MGFPSAGIGKSGGARVIYLHVPEQETHYLVMIYGKSRKKDLTRKKKTPSGKLRTKSEILAALDEMEFSGPALVSAAQGMADALSGRKKVTLRTFHVSPRPSFSRRTLPPFVTGST